MSKKIFYTGDEIKKIANGLLKNVNQFENSLAKIQNDLSSLLDENNTSWSGENAYRCVKACSANIDHDRELLKNVRKCSDYVQSVIES